MSPYADMSLATPPAQHKPPYSLDNHHRATQRPMSPDPSVRQRQKHAAFRHISAPVMSRGTSQYLPQGMETSIPPARHMRPPNLRASYEMKPLPPPPAQKSQGRWSHLGTAARPPTEDAWKPMSTRPLASPTETSSIYSQDSHAAASAQDPAPTSNGTYFDGSKITAAPNRRQTSMVPPRPPREPATFGLTQLPNRSDSSLSPYGPYRPDGPPAIRRQRHHMSARDMYHSTAAQIARSSRDMPPPEDREKKTKSRFFSKDGLSFASRVLQTGRKRPPSSVVTGQPPATHKHPQRTPYPDGGERDVADPAEEESPRSGSSHYSQKFSKVFRRASTTGGSGGGGRSAAAAAKKHRQSGGSGIWYSDEEDAGEERFIPSFSRRASGPDTPRPTTHKTGEHWSELKAHARRAAGAMTMSKEERRRAALRAKIRVIPE